MKSLSQMQEEIFELNKEKGWFDKERTFGDDIALLHSEVSEALEDYRKNIHQAQYYYEDIKPMGVNIELADILIRLLDMCERYEIDLEQAYEIKMAYNRTRPYRHGNKVL